MSRNPHLLLFVLFFQKLEIGLKLNFNFTRKFDFNRNWLEIEFHSRQNVPFQSHLIPNYTANIRHIEIEIEGSKCLTPIMQQGAFVIQCVLGKPPIKINNRVY